MDYSQRSAHEFAELIPQWENIDLEPYRRFVIYQAWRPTSVPHYDSQLAVTDGRTTVEGEWHLYDSARPPADVAGNTWESRIGQANPAHRWYSISAMTPDELLLFKGYDSQPSTNRHILHTSFTNPGGLAQSRPRTSIETRYFAYFE